MDAPTVTAHGDWLAPLAERPVDATVTLPGSKSLTNRYLVLAALANGTSRLRRPLRSRDTLLMAQALRSLGAGVEDLPGDDPEAADWLVTPADPERRQHGRLRAGRHGDAVPAAGRDARGRTGGLRRRRARPATAPWRP